MQPRKFRILSAIMAGSLTLAVVAITASSGTSQTATNTALAAKTETFPPVNLNDCPTLHTGYPTGGCVAQLQTDLNIIQDNSLTVDGIFGPVDSQTYKAVIAFQGAHGLQQDGMVGPATKQALDAALSVHPPTGAPATAPAPSTPTTTGPATSQPLQYVALGDSYSSGEGLAPFLPGTDTATDSCHRSTQAYSQYVMPKPNWFEACSMQTEAALSSPTMKGQERAQGTYLNQDTGLVTFTFGGNDLEWPSVLWDCTKIQSAIVHNTWFYTSNACNQDISLIVPERIQSMKANLVAAYTQVLSEAPNAQVRVLTYPPMFPDRGDSSSGCRIGRFGPAQAAIASDVERQVVGLEQQANAAIADAVQQVQAAAPGGSRLQLVDVTQQFGGYQGHTVSCGATGRPTPWINSLRMSTTGAAQIDLDASAGRWSQLHSDLFDFYSASFHPTHEGQYQMYLALAPTLPAGWH
jgi:peptidoglycan hydrolase-like protein with peptidoglycan-binding domain